LGTLLLAATPQGLVRVACEDHADAAALRAHAASRRGSQAARAHLAEARALLDRYFAGDSAPLACAVDWERLEQAAPAALQAVESIPYAGRRSYSDLGVSATGRELGRIMGSNPIPIVVPCHRVTRGTESPAAFVGGLDRRRWLELHEHQHDR
jgi:methylated-DNA-[protein]-cysteine S-methyltransferase